MNRVRTTSDGLSHTEEKGHVTVDTFGLEHLGSLNTLPGGGNLDEDTVLGDASILVEGDQAAGLRDGGFNIETETSIDLGGHNTRDNLGDLGTEVDGELVEGGRDLLLTGTSALLSELNL